MMFKMHILTFLFGLFHQTLAFNKSSVDELAAHFSEALSPGSQVWLPSSANYTSAITQRWTIYPPAEPTYILALKPALPSDIQIIIQFASNHNIPFMATGGGHGYSATLHSCKNGIDIDLGFFHDIEIDKEASTITIGGSIKFGELLKPLFDVGKEIQTGLAECVGVVGATLGAGLGPYTGIHGLVIDALLEVKYVTGNGELITASKTENLELFWGARGAGHQFGVVYEATYRIHDATNNGELIVATMRFHSSDSASLWEIMKDIGNDQPREMSLAVQVNWNDDFGGLNIVVNAKWVGPMEEALIAFAPFLSLDPIQRSISQVPWTSIYGSSVLGGGSSSCDRGAKSSNWAVNLYTISTPAFTHTLQKLAEFYFNFPSSRTSVWSIEKFANSVTLSTQDNETAYPWRNTTIYTFVALQVNGDSQDDAINAFGASFQAEMAKSSGYDDLRVYINYGRDEGEEVWYSEGKLPRLKALKRKYDPMELFSHYNPVKISEQPEKSVDYGHLGRGLK
ncbi:uncharacterized protein EAE97_008347 [Botrytis byssoidea]|uniref:FAD-binding PCMH-type domain-containing protein n=1 Tax=Botrytis byssoidea TaxID=139641 RepID=A0A9P5ICJ5_9HELO|nr:uncharacterized protein EAE97_008347 [Botrytis byssoidea]KAF7935440.1 hypothetical protein EAE97_008347 [Botrytis byssoidea]